MDRQFTSVFYACRVVGLKGEITTDGDQLQPRQNQVWEMCPYLATQSSVAGLCCILLLSLLI